MAVGPFAGASLTDAVRVGAFLREMGNFPAMNEIWREFFAEPFPARTIVQSDLPRFEIVVDAVLFRDR
jgi:enamine deaminase RidA (YjgF/YER057c/UK114 family)